MFLVLPDGRRVKLEKSVLSIGADPACDVVLVAAEVKPSHALLLRDLGGLTVVPGATTGRIRVNGKKVDTASLKPGDVLGLGEAELRVEASAPASTRAADARARALEHLVSFASRLLARRPARELLEQSLWGLLEATDADGGFLVLQEAHGRRVLASTGTLPEGIVADTLVDRAFASGAPVTVEDVTMDAALASAPSVVSLRIHSAIAVPLRVSGVPSAVVYLGRGRTKTPFGPDETEVALALTALTALLLSTSAELLALGHQIEGLTERLKSATFDGIVGESAVMRELYRQIERLGPTTLSVCIQGETGTGKELVARALHRRSGRRGRFVALSCGAIPESLAERELFGHVAGAFSGAQSSSPGMFEAADGGTLFLDEVGEMPPSLQVKLLRALQEKEITRLGDTRARKVDVRIIAATHVDLKAAVRSGAFRADLLFRLQEVTVHVPALRERSDDVLLIAHHVLRTERGAARSFTHRAEEVLRGHRFPGNVRELVSVVRRAALLTAGEVIDPDALGLEQQAAALPPLDQARDAFVRSHVREAIARAGGNKRKAAEALGIGLRSLFRYIGEEESE